MNKHNLDSRELKTFLKGWLLTLCFFAVPVFIQFSIVLENIEPKSFVIPLIISNTAGFLIGWTNVLRLQLKLSIQSRSRIFTSVSHEFRTPLNAINGFAQLLMLEDDIKNNDVLRDYVSEIELASKNFLILVNDILEFAALEEGKFRIRSEKVLVADVIDDVFSALRPLVLKEDISLGRDLSMNECVIADADRLRQIILNLVANAIKYNRKGGSVFIHAQKKTKKLVRISVEDNGMGIPDDRLELIFEYFERANSPLSSVEGTGIGLALCKNLIEAMGGSIGLNSSQSRGSRFWVELPAAEA
ncbi:MAG: HAMP domain-containing histidine kinase [Gammaproteobacteria bacterium]|nr:HAMP domain-containing histidine kinase [Gammaproteobacteria bacterium]